MSLKGKIAVQREVKCHGDVFHELYRHKPLDLVKASPDHIQSCVLHDGDVFGSVGSINYWEYTHAGKQEKIKTLIEAEDEEKNTMTFRAIEGDIFEVYKEWRVTLQVDKNEEKGSENHMVTWIFEYEKVNDDVPEPLTYVEFFLNFSKDIEAHGVNKKNDAI